MSIYRTEDGAQVRPTSLIRYDAPVTVTIANTETTSTAVDARSAALFGVALPAAFTGTSLTFTVCSTEDGTYQTLEDSTGNAVSLTVEQGKSYTLPNELAPWPWFKIVSGSAEGGSRSLIVTRKR